MNRATMIEETAARWIVRQESGNGPPRTTPR